MLKLIGAILIAVNFQYVYCVNLEPHIVLPALQINARLIGRVQEHLQDIFNDTGNKVWYRKPESLISILDGKSGLYALDHSIKKFRTSIETQNNLPISIEKLFQSHLSMINNPSIQSFVQGLSAYASSDVSVSSDLLLWIKINAQAIHGIVDALGHQKLFAIHFAYTVRESGGKPNTATSEQLLSYSKLFINVVNYIPKLQEFTVSYLKKLSELLATLKSFQNSNLANAVSTLETQILNTGAQIQSQISNLQSASEPDSSGYENPHKIFILDEMIKGIMVQLSAQAKLISRSVKLILNEYH